MKKYPSRLSLAMLAFAAPALLPAQVTQIWSVGTGVWNTSNTNWSDTVWTNGNNAQLSTTGTRTGAITVDAGGVTVNNVTLNASGSGAVYGYTIDGGSLTLAGANSVWSTGGPTGSNLLVNSIITGGGGIEKIGTRLLILAGDNTYAGTTTVSAGSLQIGNGGTTGSVAGNIVANNGLTFNRTNTLTYSGVISGTSSVTQAGTGTLVLTNANTYAGNTQINAGVLRVEGSLASASVNANAGGTYTGSGSLAGNLNINDGGIFHPGNTIGQVDVAGSVTFGPTSVSTFEIAGSGRGVGYDSVSIGGVLTPGGQLVLEFATALADGTYTIASYTSVAPLTNFASVTVDGTLDLPLVDSGDGLWTASDGGYVFDLLVGATETTLTVSAIPEPSTSALLGGMLVVGCLGYRRFQR